MRPPHYSGHFTISCPASSLDLNLESSSAGDIMEESDWDLNSEVAVATGVGGVLLRGSSRAEKEIRCVCRNAVLSIFTP